jgi:hypothetical protein
MRVDTFLKRVDENIAGLKEDLKIQEDLKKIPWDDPVVSEKIYKTIPPCQIEYDRNPNLVKYKPTLYGEDNWVIFVKGGHDKAWYLIEQGKVYVKKDPTLRQIFTYFSR